MLVRQDFPVTKKMVYMNNGAIAPTPLSTIKAVTDFMLKCAVEGPDSKATADYIVGILDELRERIAYLINCYKEEVILVQSTTEGLNMVANGLGWKEGESIVVRGGKSEHHANYFPWLAAQARHKINLREVPVDREGFFEMADLERASKGARLVTMTHVLYNTGSIMPVEEVAKIARENGALFCIDAAQSAGSIPVDVRKISCDFMAFPAFKWLVGPLGIGVLYCSRRSSELLSPSAVGGESATLSDNGVLAISEMPSRYQAGFRNYPGAAGFEASLRYVLRIGIDNIRKHNTKVSEALREQVLKMPGAVFHGPPDPDTRSSILTFSLPADTSMVIKKLEECGVVLAERDIGAGKKAIRAAPHFFNTEEEAAMVASHLKSVLS